jgi:uncharacterized membrane protein
MNKNFVYIAIIYLIIDILWIYLMTPMLYNKVFSTIQKSPMKANMYYAVLAYIILLIVIYLICIPLSETYKKHKWFAFTIVGFSIYSIYNLTNAVTFENYPMKMIIIDSLWGSCVFTFLGVLYLTLNKNKK